MAILGIDVSYYQGNIDWMRVKNSGVKFAILRLGYTGYASAKNKAVDPMFETYYKNAKAVGLPVGVYYFSRATTVEEGVSEANFVLKHLEGKQLEYPVYIDVEDNYYQANASKANLTDAVKAFCNTLEAKKYYVGIYANVYWFNNKLNLNELVLYDKWVAQWNTTNTFKEKYGMWQFSSTGNVGGISPVDLDYAYKDFPAIMKEYGLNGYTKIIENDKPVPDDKEEEKPIEDNTKPDEGNVDNSDLEKPIDNTNENIFVKLLKGIKALLKIVYRVFKNIFKKK